MLNNMFIRTQVRNLHRMEDLSRKLTAKKTGNDELIVKIILMVVAVVLCVFFRDSLKTIITTLLSRVESNINGMFS